jgi:WD40 repeat protein
MREAFDPYHRWLAIPPKHQPPNCYRLLGLELYEDDAEVIRDAAAQRMAHVRTYQLGQYSELSQRILNELAGARACLLDQARKAEYDRELRASLRQLPTPDLSDLLAAASVGEDGGVRRAPAAAQHRGGRIDRRWWAGGIAVAAVLAVALLWSLWPSSPSPPGDQKQTAHRDAPAPPPPPPGRESAVPTSPGSKPESGLRSNRGTVGKTAPRAPLPAATRPAKPSEQPPLLKAPKPASDAPPRSRRPKTPEEPTSSGDPKATAEASAKTRDEKQMTVPGIRVVSEVAFSPDGRRIIGNCVPRDLFSGIWHPSKECAVAVWNAFTGAQMKVFEEYRGWKFSADGKTAVSENADGPFAVWDVSAVRILLTRRGSGAVFSPDGSMVAAQWRETGKRHRSGGGATVWSVATEAIVFQGPGISFREFSPDCKRIALVSTRTDLFSVWDIAKRKNAFTKSARFEAFSPNGALVIGKNALYDASNGKNVTPSGRTIRQISADRKWVVLQDDHQNLSVWDVVGHRESFPLGEDMKNPSRLELTPDGKRLVAVSRDRTLKMWDMSTGKGVIREHNATFERFILHGRWVALRKARKSGVWDATSGEPVPWFPVDSESAIAAMPLGPGMMPPGGPGMMPMPGGRGPGMMPMPGGRGGMMPPGGRPGMMPGERTISPQYPKLSGRITDGNLELSANGCWISIGSKILDASSGKEVAIPAGEFAGFSPDGNRAVFASSKVEPLASPSPAPSPRGRGGLSPLPGQPTPTPVPPSLPRKGKEAGDSAIEDRKATYVLKVLDLRERRVIFAADVPVSFVPPDASHPARTGLLTSLAISPDGSRIVAAASDGTLRVWKLPSSPGPNGPEAATAEPTKSAAGATNDSGDNSK